MYYSARIFMWAWPVSMILSALLQLSPFGTVPTYALDVKVDALSMSMPQLVAYGESLVFEGKMSSAQPPRVGQGQCAQCHSFDQKTNSHFFAGPNLGGITDRAELRLVEHRYHRGEATRRETVIKEAYPGSGTAESALEYITESLVCPSCYVVSGYGAPGSKGRESSEPEVTQSPIDLKHDEMVAIVTWLYVNDGKRPPSAEVISSAFKKFMTPSEWMRFISPRLPDPWSEPPPVLATGDERVDEIFQKAQCVVCHDIPGISGATGTVGPPLNMKTLAPRRLRDAKYKGGARTFREYVRESILKPNVHVAEGYIDDVMPKTYARKLTVSAVEKMVDYLLELEEGGAVPKLPTIVPADDDGVRKIYFRPMQFSPLKQRDDVYQYHYSRLLDAADEPTLLDIPLPNNAKIRMIWDRSQHDRLIVRIEKEGEKIRLFAKRVEAKSVNLEPDQLTFKVADVREREVGLGAWDDLQASFRQADFWELPGAREPTGGKDGAGWVVEISDWERYPLVDRWSPTTGGYREACLKLLRLSGFPMDPIY